MKKLISKRGLTNFFILPSKNHNKLAQYFTISDFAIGLHPDYDDLYKYGLCPLKTYDYMFYKLPILFIGNKSYLDIESEGIFESKFNNQSSFIKSLNKINYMSKNDLKKLGTLNYNIVQLNNSPDSISRKFMEIFKGCLD